MHQVYKRLAQRKNENASKVLSQAVTEVKSWKNVGGE